MIVKTSNIKAVKFKVPGLFSKKGEKELTKKFKELQNMKDTMAKKHIEIMQLEQKIKNEEEALRIYNSFIEIEYETKEVEDKVHGECNLIITNPSDARNVNYGKQ